MTKSGFRKKLIALMKEQGDEFLDLDIYIQKSANDYKNKNCIRVHELDFDIDFEEDIYNYREIDFDWSRVSFYFEGVTFKGKVRFANIRLKELSFKDVIFQENVGIKNVQLKELCLRPYRIDAHVVVNIGKYEQNGIIVDCDNDCYIEKIEFEDPHICSAKLYFIGINEKTKGDFRNRNLENVVFQNCNFTQTYFLNSFLKETKFLNCEFPLVHDETVYFFWDKKHPVTTFLIYILGLLFLLSIFYSVDFPYKEIFLTIFSPAGLLIGIVLIYLVFQGLFKIFSIKNSLVGKHFGIIDESKYKEEIEKKYKERTKRIERSLVTLKNIEAIYSDLKINFKNNGDEQKSGDFYYSSRYTRTRLPIGYIDRVVLMGSYLINGFGERPLRSFIALLIILTTLGYFCQPSRDYISTPHTPNFLLQATLDTNNTLPYAFRETSFIEYKEKCLPKNDNVQYVYKKEFVRIPKLKDDYVTRIYFATSHLAMPFVNFSNSRQWFRGVTDRDYLISIVSSLLLWLYLIGMIKAIFNRMKR